MARGLAESFSNERSTHGCGTKIAPPIWNIKNFWVFEILIFGERLGKAPQTLISVPSVKFPPNRPGFAEATPFGRRRLAAGTAGKSN
ncbi:MAG: hypothetical protein KDC54_16625 [Lewinella sp.]|nr:hypothetical protein [Lewinella sp.]